MKPTKRMIWSIGLTVLVVLVGAANSAPAQEGFFVEEGQHLEGRHVEKNHVVFTCRGGGITQVIDAADDTVHFTPAIFGTAPGGGEGGEFDPVPLLTIPAVDLRKTKCLNAHLSFITGSGQTYGVAPLALFQVSLTSATLGPVHMVGHYDTPYGIPAPAVALEAETDVDMLAANFFQKFGNGPHEVPPGIYDVDVWWAGAPPGSLPPGGIGAAVVLKLYLSGGLVVQQPPDETDPTEVP